MLQAELETKQKLRDALQEKLRQKRAFGLPFYQPHPKQEKFHRSGTYKRRYVRTGNRFGKSDMGAAEDCSWALGYRPFFDKGDPDQTRGIPKRPTKGLIICQDWDKAQEIFTAEEDGLGRGKLLKFLPDVRKNPDKKAPGIVGFKKNSSGITQVKVRSMYGGISSIYLDTVKSFKLDGMSQESSNWDWVHIDEPCPQSMWKAVSRGLVDAHGSAWFTCTPLRERWINDMFVPGRYSHVDEKEANVFQINGADRWIMIGSMHDNPHLSEGAKKEFIADLSKDEIATRIEGRPAHYQGVIYPQFQYDRHVIEGVPKGWKDAFTPPRNWNVRLSIDPHPRKPHAVLFAAISPLGEVFIYHEIFEQLNFDELAEAIRQHLGDRVPESSPCDWMAFEEPQDSNARCLADHLDDYDIPVHKAPRALSQGILETRQALAKKNFIHVLPHMDRFLYEIESYVWDHNKEKPVDNDDHMMENFYRLVMEGLDYNDPIYNNSSRAHVIHGRNTELSPQFNLPDLDTNVKEDYSWLNGAGGEWIRDGV
tara:strand:- start:211 stop:1818 length:1608 start_codon:yes stop_codon:yes gene_type:complete